jgi:hypothetical protein
VETEKDDRTESEWFALLALYLIDKHSELHTSETYLHFIRHALNTAKVSDERASVLEYRISQSRS